MLTAGGPGTRSPSWGSSADRSGRPSRLRQCSQRVVSGSEIPSNALLPNASDQNASADAERSNLRPPGTGNGCLRGESRQARRAASLDSTVTGVKTTMSSTGLPDRRYRIAGSRAERGNLLGDLVIPDL